MNDPVLLALDEILRAHADRLAPVVARLTATLAQSPNAPQAWEPLPQEFFRTPLPDGIVSSWIFALRAKGVFPSERHPNSWQRSITVRGSALFEVFENERWEPRPISGDGSALMQRAVSIPPNTWHRIRIGPETFVSLSFHTAAAAELIEETCVGDDFSKTRSRRYHA